jgi:hypothetical protein
MFKGGPLTMTQVVLGGRCGIMQITQLNVQGGPLTTTQVVLCGIMQLT